MLVHSPLSPLSPGISRSAAVCTEAAPRPGSRVRVLELRRHHHAPLEELPEHLRASGACCSAARQSGRSATSSAATAAGVCAAVVRLSRPNSCSNRASRVVMPSRSEGELLPPASASVQPVQLLDDRDLPFLERHLPRWRVLAGDVPGERPRAGALQDGGIENDALERRKNRLIRHRHRDAQPAADRGAAAPVRAAHVELHPPAPVRSIADLERPATPSALPRPAQEDFASIPLGGRPQTCPLVLRR